MRQRQHPLARAVVRAAQDRGLAMPPNPSACACAGARHRAARRLGASYLVGSLRWMDELGVDLGAASACAAAARRGATVSAVVGRSAQGLAVAAPMSLVGDEPETRRAQALAQLRARKACTVMISGDNKGAAEVMATPPGLDRTRAK